MSEIGSKLGGLPQLSYGPVYAQPAPVPHNPNPGGPIFEALADTAQGIQKIYEPAAEKEAAAKGAASVTRDAQGNLQAPAEGLNFTPLDQAYNNAAQLKYMSEAALDIRPKIADLQAKYRDDPNGFKAGLDGLLTGATKSAPPQFQQPLTEMILREGGAAQQDLAQQKLRRDTIEAQQSVDTVLQSHENSLMAYARQGKLDDPQAQVLMKEYQDLVRAKVANPVFAYSQAQADQDIGEFQGQMKAQAIIGNVGKLYTQYGKQKAMEESEKLIDDPALNLSPRERETYAQQARQEIRILDAGTRDEQNELRRQVEYRVDDARAAALATGDYTKVLSDDEIERAYGKNAPRAQQIIGQLRSATEIYSMRKSVAMATPQQLSDMDKQYNPATNGAGQTPTGFNAVWSKWMAPTEGGYKAADSNGAPVNMGINQKANPDLDVKNMTPAQLAQVAKDRYWTPSGADKLPPDLAAVQFDTAMNMGVGEANKLLAKSNGDVRSYLDLREQAYRDIAATKPDEAKNLPAWLQRNEALRNFVTGGNVADAARVYQAFHEAVNQRNEAVVKDPAAYVLANRQDVAQMLSSNDPAQVQSGVRSMLTIQSDIGVSQPRILAKQQEQAIVASFENPPDPTKRADGMNGVIDTLAARYGDYFPQVMKDLQRAGMPPEAAALYQTRGMGAASVRMATAINSMSQMGKDINAGRDAFFSGAPGNSEIRKAIPGTMDDYNKTMIGTADGPQQIQATNYAVALYARQLAYEGMDPDKAAQQAHDDLIGARYNFVDSYRVPRGIDQSAVASGANAVKLNLKAQDLEPYGGAAPGVSIDDRRALSQRILSSQGVWVTRSDDKGLSLVWPQSTGFLPALDAKGNPISLSWSALQSNAKPSLFRRAVSGVESLVGK